jgi:hypothetical protein
MLARKLTDVLPSFSRRRRPRSPDREASLDRRWNASMGGYLPARIGRFTQGEAAVLAIVAQECALHGLCTLAVDAIAALAGTCARLVQYAIGIADAKGVLVRRERRRRGRKSLTNEIRIVDPFWRDWIKVRARKAKAMIAARTTAAISAPFIVDERKRVSERCKTAEIVASVKLSDEERAKWRDAFAELVAKLKATSAELAVAERFRGCKSAHATSRFFIDSRVANGEILAPATSSG